jgi:hypothetical protein
MELREMPREVEDGSFFFKYDAFKHTASCEWEKRDLENSEYWRAGLYGSG